MSQIHHDVDIIKTEIVDIPLKKNKLEEFSHLPFNMQQLYTAAALDPMYLQYFHELQTNRHHLSAFKPFPPHGLKESKIRMGINRYSDPPVLQHPERVVPLSETKRFEQSYQPNVALAPPTPKKFRYGKTNESLNCKDVQIKEENVATPKEETVPILNESSVIKHEKHVEVEPSPIKCVVKRSPEQQSVIDSTVSVVQSTGNLTRYNSEIELSTDTDDSASESSEKQSDLLKIEEALKSVDGDIKHRILELVKNIAKEHEVAIQECRHKDNKIAELEFRIAQLEKQLFEQDNLECNTISNNVSKLSPIYNGVISKDSSSHCPKSTTPSSVEEQEENVTEIVVLKENVKCEINSSSITVINNDAGNLEEKQMKSVITNTESLEPKAITPNAPE